MHRIEGSNAPDWIGSDQVRQYQFLGANRLQLTASVEGDASAEAAGAGGSNVLVWDRVS